MSSDKPYGDPETRKRILDATWELLEKEGADVTLTEISGRVGVSRQAVYLHFGDRAGLFVALVDHIDRSLGSEKLREHVFGAPSGVETLRRWVETMSWYTGKIDRISQIMEWSQHDDPAFGTGWRDRMDGRRGFMIGITRRLADEGRLATAWTPEEAADLIYVITMPGPWREMTQTLGWSEDEYVERVWRLLERAILAPED